MIGKRLERHLGRHAEAQAPDVLPGALELQGDVRPDHVEVTEVALDPLPAVGGARAARAEDEIHRLREAGTQSEIGPNLDAAFSAPKSEDFDESTIRATVRDQIAYAVEPMPRNLVKGDAANDVAAYVAAVAANPGDFPSTRAA